MRAFTLDSFDVPPRLRDDLPEPEPGDGEVAVRVHASSVNPVDAFVASGMLRQYAEYDFPVTIGRDFAGVVEAVGPGVTRLAPGDEVFGFVAASNPAAKLGTWSERIVFPAESYGAAKPVGVDVAVAGAAALVAIAALAAVDAIAPQPGETVLVVGATGGVGSCAVQLLAASGARVVAPALAEDADYLRALGVSELVDRNADLAAAVRELAPDGVDAAVDLASWTPETAPLLRDGGRLASPNSAAGEGEGRFNIAAEPSPANVARVAALLESGALRIAIQATYDLAEAGEAMAALQTTHTRGKIAVRV